MKTGALAADGGSEGAVALTARMEIKIDIKSSQSMDTVCPVYPTNPFKMLELQNPSQDVPERHKS